MTGLDLATPQVLKERYEAIVIGAGIGGLTTAALLASQGVEVLLVEQSHEPGGCCSSLRIGDFTFDTAASVLRGFGEVGFHVMRTLFDSLGQQVELVPRDSSHALYLGEQRIDFHRDRNAFTAELGALFPQQAGSVLAYIRELEHLYRAVLDCSGPLRPPGDEPAGARWGLFARHPASVSRVSRAQRMTAEKMLARHVNDPMVRAFFDADLAYNSGYRLSELSVPHAALAVIDRHVGGTHHAIGSAQQVADKLEKSINENGGRVVYRAAVESVLVKEGAARGVRLDDGKAVLSDAVVANSTCGQLFGRLVPREHLKRSTVEWVESLKPSRGVMALYLGVPESTVPEDFNPSTVLVDNPSREPERFISVSIPSMFDPNLSPEGFHSVTIHCACDPGAWPSPSADACLSSDYAERREAEVSRILERLSPILPGLGSGVVARAVVTPTTFERITRRDGGALAGPCPPGLPAPAGLPGCVTEINGLFLAGGSTFFGHGVAEAAASGIYCALELLRRLRHKTPRLHPAVESYVLETVPIRPIISGQEVVDSISAVLESHRCMRCESAPCMSSCPAGIDVPNMMRRVAAADFSGAARVVRESNPLGEVCGLVCPASSLCEGACNRGREDSSLKISQMEAFVCGCSRGPEGWPEPYRGRWREKVAVVGSGPAGLSCAFHMALLGLDVEVFDEAMEVGGLPAHAMADFRLNRQILTREIEGAMGAGIAFRGNTSFGEDINFEYLWREGFAAVFLAAGLQRVSEPSLRGLDLPGVIDALSFLVSAHRKVKRELTPNVAVLGGGDLAVDTALLAVEMGADRVYLVTGNSEVAAHEERLEEARDRGVRVLANRKAVELKGEGRVESMWAPEAGRGPGNGTSGGAEPPVVPVGTVVYAGRREMSPALAAYLAGQLKLTPNGLVEVDLDTLATSRPGVFAGGEIAGGDVGLVASACAQGRRAALSINEYLKAKAGGPHEESAAS